MAEAIAALSLVSSILQLVDFGSRLVSRLDEFAAATNDVPESFRSINVKLPLVIQTLQSVQDQALSGSVPDATAKALIPVVDSTVEQAQILFAILEKAAPVGNFSTFQKRLHALKSLSYDKKVQRSIEKLESNIQILIFHQTASHSNFLTQGLSQLSISTPIKQPEYGHGVNLGTAPQIDHSSFIGRETELEQLCELLTSRASPTTQNIVAIVAAGGFGKTQLAIAFANQHQDAFSSIFWLNAKDESTLKQDLVSFSDTILDKDQQSGSGSRDEDKTIQRVRQWFSRPGNDQWLLILDNYDDPRLPNVQSPTAYDIRGYFPARSQGSILITTRSHRLTFAKQLSLHKLGKLSQSLEILGSRSGRDLEEDPDAALLAERLDGLPLALATAGTYLAQTGGTAAEYLRIYNECWRDLEENAEELLEYEDRTLFSTWNLSLNQVQTQLPEAAELLRLFAYFGNEGINYELLKAGRESQWPWLCKLMENKIKFDRAMIRLHAYSLVEVSAEGYYLHTCVHDWTLQALNGSRSVPHYWLAVRCIASNVKTEEQRGYWENNQRLLKHASRLEHQDLRDLLDQAELDGSLSHDLHLLAVLWRHERRFPRSKDLYERALRGKEKTIGLDDPSTLDTVNNLAILYSQNQRLEEAEQMYKRAYTGYEKTLGLDHPATINMINNIGVLYKNQGRLTEAEQMYQRALAGYEKYSGPGNIVTIHAARNLGVLYQQQGKFVEAESMYQRALIAYQEKMGVDHPSTSRTVHYLCGLYVAQRRLSDVVRLTSAHTSGSRNNLLFGYLGRALLQHNDESNAQASFRQQLKMKNGTLVYHNCFCDTCRLPLTSARGRFVCEQCTDVDLCGQCVQKHHSGLERLPSCGAHTFLAVSHGLPMDEADRSSWLESLQTKPPAG